VPFSKGFLPETKWNRAHPSLFLAGFQPNFTVGFYKNFQTLAHFNDLSLNFPMLCTLHSSLIKIKAHFKKVNSRKNHSVVQASVVA
jgi:hypothetical protein